MTQTPFPSEAAPRTWWPFAGHFMLWAATTAILLFLLGRSGGTSSGPSKVVFVDDAGRGLMALSAGLACRWRGRQIQDPFADTWRILGTALVVLAITTADLFIAADLL